MSSGVSQRSMAAPDGLGLCAAKGCTVPALKGWLKGKGLKVGGKKEELIARVTLHARA